MSSTRPAVALCIVSHNSADDLPACLESAGRLSYRPLEIVVVDCASQDDSLAAARRSAPRGLSCRLVELGDNLGFAGGMNRALRETHAPYVLTLNPDARPTAGYVDRLVQRAERHPDLRVGAVTGRLVRLDSDPASPILDACGIRLTLTWRHLDRGSSQPDRGQWSLPERVFGATGAASLFYREALDDVAIDGEIFANEFHSFREDAEISFRLHERGWEILYEPAALCRHRRNSLPERRRAMAATTNFHSLKNRYLLRAYHQDPANFFLTLLPTSYRDLLALVFVIVAERSSLPAYGWLWRHRREILARRRYLRSRRTCSGWQINRWFLRRGLPL